jgi:2-furoyl-CoA dehydrogenase large subunit
MLLDADTLAAIIPGCHAVDKLSDTHFQADVTLGVGPVKGRYRAEVRLSDLVPPRSATLHGSAHGALGFGRGTGHVILTLTATGTQLSYRYRAEFGGKAAAIGGRLLDAAAQLIIRQFFAALARRGGGGKPGILARLTGMFGRQP